MTKNDEISLKWQSVLAFPCRAQLQCCRAGSKERRMSSLRWNLGSGWVWSGSCVVTAKIWDHLYSCSLQRGSRSAPQAGDCQEMFCFRYYNTVPISLFTGILGKTEKKKKSTYSSVLYILKVKDTQSCPHSVTLWLHGLYSPWDSPGQNTGVGSLSLFQGIFPTQGSNLGLPHCRRILYQGKWSCMCAELLQWCPTLCDAMDCSRQAYLSMGFSWQE